MKVIAQHIALVFNVCRCVHFHAVQRMKSNLFRLKCVCSPFYFVILPYLAQAQAIALSKLRYCSVAVCDPIFFRPMPMCFSGNADDDCGPRAAIDIALPSTIRKQR